MSSESFSKRHVCFGLNELIPKDNTIEIKQTSPGYVQVHLGFLQFNYTYSMIIDIPKCYFLGFSTKSILDAVEKSTPNVNCKLISAKEKQDAFEFTLEFHAQKERLLREDLKFLLEGNVKLIIEFNARVLGPGKGTPLLKNGIRCIGVAKDDLSDASDCQK